MSYGKSNKPRLVWAWQTPDEDGRPQSYRIVIPALGLSPVLEVAHMDSMGEVSWSRMTDISDNSTRVLISAIWKITRHGCLGEAEREKSRLAAQDRSV